MDKINKVSEKLIHIFMFLSVLFIGADLFSVEIKYTFKLPQIFLMILTGLLIITKKYKIRKDKYMIAFAITSFISTIFALSVPLAIAYYLYILVNIITIYFCVASYVEHYGIKKILEIIRITFFIQLGILLFQYLLVVVFNYEIPFMPSYGEYLGVPRFRLWFYEPSYMATYVLVWLTIGLTYVFIYNDKEYIKDVIGALIILVLSTSTSGFVGIAAAFGFIFLLWIIKGWNKQKLILPLILISMFIAIKIIFPDMYELFIGRLFNSSLNDATGGRIDKWLDTFKVFLEYPLFGVGPGNYGFYFGETINFVPSNVTLDLMATLGIFGLIFYAIHGKLLYDIAMAYKNKQINKKNKKEYQILVAFYLGLIIFVLILQVNQGYLRLYHWLLLGIIFGGVNKYKEEVKKMIIRSKTPLRLGLAGGGTDVSPFCDKHGGCVLNVTIDMYAYCTIVPTKNNKIIFNAPDRKEKIELSSKPVLEINELALHCGIYNRIVKDYNNNKPLSFEMTTYSDAPAGSGLGSSSTMVVTIIKAYMEWLKLPLGEYEMAKLAYDIERKDLGFVGGKQDQYAATFGGFNYMEFSSNDKVIVNPLKMKKWIKNELQNSMFLFYTGTSRDSGKIIEEQSNAIKTPKSLESMFEIKKQTEKMKEAILTGNFKEVAKTLNKNWEAKKKTSDIISNPQIEEIYNLVISNKAKAAKISGAGGGGFMLIFCDPVDRYDLINKLKNYNEGKVKIISFVDFGAQAWTLYED